MALKMEYKKAMIMNLSEGLLIEILVRLPVISLLRFKCVCKSWCSIISSPFFIAKHLQVCNSTTNYPNLLVKTQTMSENDNWVEKMFIVSHGTLQVVEIQENPPGSIRPDWFPKILGCCNGLVCLYDPFRDVGFIWNPATRETKLLPPSLMPRESRLCCIDVAAHGFGFDEENNVYKVFQIRSFKDSGSGSEDSEAEGYEEAEEFSKLDWFWFEVYSLRMDSWKLVKGTQGMYLTSIDEDTAGAYTNGMISWLAYDQFRHPEILSFDISNEEIITTPLPSEVGDDVFEYDDFFIYVGVFNGSVAVLNDACYCIDVSEVRDTFLYEFWVLREVGLVESWTKLYTIGFLDWLDTAPLGIWNENLVIWFKSDEEPFLYDFVNKEQTSIGIPHLKYRCKGFVTYKESLVPIKG